MEKHCFRAGRVLGKVPARRNGVRIAIVGAGTTGAYCHSLLRKQGLQVDIFDRTRKTACGINPCAWGTSRGFTEQLKAAGLDPDKYILQRFDSVIMDEVRIQGELMTIHKPALIRDLLGGAKVKGEPFEMADYGRVIDATGIARAFLPPIKNDVLLPCVQQRIQPKKQLENRIQLGRLGYAWCFPLGEFGVHIGCGSLVSNPNKMLKEIGWLSNPSPSSGQKPACACAGNVRLTGPHDALPFVTERTGIPVWGIGEAIGCVAPLAGDGIVPGMKSVSLLIENWENPDEYTRSILREFEWMKNERTVIDKILAATPIGIKEAWVLRKNSKRMGMRVGMKEAVKFLKMLRLAGI
jgi:flavin-dependent dehydrogenase